MLIPSIDVKFIFDSAMFRVVQLRKIFSKWQMSPFELSSCCPCHVFSYCFAQFLLLKRVKVRHFCFHNQKTQSCPQVFSVNDALFCIAQHCLGPGSAVGEKGKKTGSNRNWGGLPPISARDFFLLSPQCGAALLTSSVD